VWNGPGQALPQAGLAVVVRGEDDRITASRIYGDVEPPQAGEA
jgi:hypothetical protein